MYSRFLVYNLILDPSQLNVLLSDLLGEFSRQQNAWHFISTHLSRAPRFRGMQDSCVEKESKREATWHFLCDKGSQIGRGILGVQLLL